MVARLLEKEDKASAHKLHSTVLSGKLRQAVRWETDRKGGGCLFPDDIYTNNVFSEVMWEKHLDM